MGKNEEYKNTKNFNHSMNILLILLFEHRNILISYDFGILILWNLTNNQLIDLDNSYMKT